MNNKVLLQFCVVIISLLTAQGVNAEPAKALINADYVRVRENPLKDAAPAGFLYKNMIVEIRSQTPEKEKIGNDSHYWYEVKGNDVSGWVYGKFLSPNVANWDVDTYDAPSDMQWLYNRFGESTWYYAQNLSMQSFSIDDYRSLMRAAEMGNEQAWIALRVTILSHLSSNPDDTDYAYLKKRLYSVQFLKAVINHGFANRPDFFDVVPISRELVAATVGDHPYIVESMPDDYWSNKEIARQVLRGPYGCNQGILAKIPQELMRDSDIQAALAHCRPDGAQRRK
jgi:hypothetical protein